jgi:hypothetical protein
MKWTHALVPACLLAFTGCEPGGEPDDDRIVAGEYEVTAPELVIHASVDGEAGTPVITDCDYSHYWDNWDWEAGAGLGPATGKLDRGTEVHWRYVTIDGNGVMARIGDDDWVFIARPCIPLEP